MLAGENRLLSLQRVCLLAPIVLILTLRHRKYLKAQGQSAQESAKVPLIPFFVLGFIAVAIIQNVFEIPTGIHDAIVLTSKLLLGAGLVALGTGVRWRAIRAIGARPMVMGLIAWALVAGVALVAVRVTGL